MRLGLAENNAFHLITNAAPFGFPASARRSG
jgi:hypothetical protein